MEILFNTTGNEFTKETIMERLLDLSSKYSSVTLNISDFCYTLQVRSNGEDDTDLEPITSMAILKTGHYATFKDMKIMVAKHVAPGYAHVEEDNDVE